MDHYEHYSTVNEIVKPHNVRKRSNTMVLVIIPSTAVKYGHCSKVYLYSTSVISAKAMFVEVLPTSVD